VDITPRIEQQAQDAVPADQANQDHSTNSVVINMGNNALALSRSTATTIRTITNNYRAMRRQLTLDTQNRTYYSALITGAYAMAYGASHALQRASLYCNDRSSSDALIAEMLGHYVVMVAGGYLFWNANDIAAAYDRAQRLPPATQPAFVRPANNAQIIPSLIDPNIAAGECPICLEAVAIRGGSQAVNCNHVYHTNCIVNWINQQAYELHQQPSCPLCRTRIDVM
jgi:hypothetical protein